MAIERYKPDVKGHVTFSFLTREEGREALKMAIDLVAGECGWFLFLSPGLKGKDIMSDHGYVSFNFSGDTNALAGVTLKSTRSRLNDELGISEDDLLTMLLPHFREYGWYKRPNVEQ